MTLSLGVGVGLTDVPVGTGESAPVVDETFTTFTAANYTPTADGTTATTLTFTAKDSGDNAIAGVSVTYA